MSSLVENAWPSGSREEDYFFLSVCFLYLFYHLPLKKGVAFHLKNVEIRSPKDFLWPSFVEIGLMVLEKKMKM